MLPQSPGRGLRSPGSPASGPVRHLGLMSETSVPRSPVLSYTEWDPLEEVVVGSVDGAVVPPWGSTLRVTMSPRSWPFLREHGGRPFPREWIDAGRRDLDGLVHLLEAEGVTV